ncbi:glycosyltransferase [Paraburkholderia sediminicola]|uniref:glycosyltransferase n=1 Tax=Paraburkholderia sediminicola TaxID=458836 RepID=UPI0038B8DF87
MGIGNDVSLGRADEFESVKADASAAFVSSASFWWPTTIVPSTWLEHAPFAFWLVGALRPSRIVEIGASDSYSYLVWCQAVERFQLDTRCYAVDMLSPSGEAGDAPTASYQRVFKEYHADHYASFSEIVASRGDSAASLFDDESIDLLHLRSSNGNGIPRRELDLWRPKLSRRAVVLVHPAALGVLNGSTDSRDLIDTDLVFGFSHGGGLRVLLLGAESPPVLRALSLGPEGVQAQIRSIYARLGAAITLRCALHESRVSLDQAAGAVLLRDKRADGATESVLSVSRDVRALAMAFGRSQYLVKKLREERKQLARLVSKNTNLVASLELERDELLESANKVGELSNSLQQVTADNRALLTSTSWRITAPIRLIMRATRNPHTAALRARQMIRQLRFSLRQRGVVGTIRKCIEVLRRRDWHALFRNAEAGSSSLTASAALPKSTVPADGLLPLRVVIIAETSIPQCLKYRVTQKQKMIESLGFDCTVVSWNDFEDCRNALQTHSLAIFYRVPAFPEPLSLIHHAREIGVTTIWEVDDLIFDAAKYLQNGNLRDVSPEIRRGVLFGVPLYREAMLACDMCIASTTGLAGAMREAGVERTFVIENALDTETTRTAEKILARPRHKDGYLRIGYGSGTKTHDADFRAAVPALLNVLRQRPNVRLCIIGELNLSSDFDAFNAQIERLPLSDYSTYLGRLADCDISIAPLENSIFNDSKSNIKFLEASAVQLPSVCSPRAAFRSAIENGINGFLAESAQEWTDALLKLIDDVAFRGEMAQRAHDSVLAHYAPATVAQEQVAPVLLPYASRESKLRILGANIYFAPRSFGGATIIAEEMTQRLNAREDTEYYMFTTLSTDIVPAYKLVRYFAKATHIFGMGLPGERDPVSSFENKKAAEAFEAALLAVKPDVVHLHAIQGIGALVADVCRKHNVPFVVTLHDAWWICGRQFMITGEQQYCNQRKIDVNVCEKCVNDGGLNTYRQLSLHDALRSASLLLAPSKFFRDLYIENDFSPGQIVVNGNGITPPSTLGVTSRSRRAGRLRFGYVGGDSHVKGIHLVKKAFESIKSDAYELILVDNMLNMGNRSIYPSQWKLRGKVTIVPAYNQQNMDEFFNGIDILLFPTQCKESFGLTVREALARNVWVITTDAGGAVEDVVNGENGDVIPLFDDGSALRAAIQKLLGDPSVLDGYENPYRSKIRTFDDQATELRDLLAHVVASEQVQPDGMGEAVAERGHPTHTVIDIVLKN